MFAALCLTSGAGGLAVKHWVPWAGPSGSAPFWRVTFVVGSAGSTSRDAGRPMVFSPRPGPWVTGFD